MAKRKAKASVEIPVLSEQVQAQFDEYLKKQKLASKGRRADEQGRALRDLIVGAMNGALLAQLPDGRRIQRVPQTRSYDAKPAVVLKWDQLNEVPTEE